MGRVKDWAMTEQFCIVCDQGFWPFEASHEVDIGAPTCSKQCYNEYCQVSEALADLSSASEHGELMPTKKQCG
jgi:hypothetical protein